MTYRGFIMHEIFANQYSNIIKSVWFKQLRTMRIWLNRVLKKTLQKVWLWISYYTKVIYFKASTQTKRPRKGNDFGLLAPINIKREFWEE